MQRKILFLTALIFIFLCIYFSGGKFRKLLDNKKILKIDNNIPKDIMQTVKNKNVPNRLKNYIDLVNKNNPSYNRKIYDDKDIENYIKNDPKLVEAYNNIKIGVVKADFFRLIWLLKNGGIYLDIDMISLKPFKNLENADMVVLHYDNYEELIFHFLACKKDNPIIKKTLEDCITNINNNTYLKNQGSKFNGYISKICGPELFTKNFKEYLDIDKLKTETIVKENLKYKILNEKDYDDILKHKYIGLSYYIDTYRMNQKYWGIDFENIKHILYN